jgi:hypothetical protein
MSNDKSDPSSKGRPVPVGVGLIPAEEYDPKFMRRVAKSQAHAPKTRVIEVTQSAQQLERGMLERDQHGEIAD